MGPTGSGREARGGRAAKPPREVPGTSGSCLGELHLGELRGRGKTKAERALTAAPAQKLKIGSPTSLAMPKSSSPGLSRWT
jgi:hypothetical protein